MKICRVVDIPETVTYTSFGEDQLGGLGVAGGQSLPFCIDFDRCPYNTLALPCECVIYKFQCIRNSKCRPNVKVFIQPTVL